MKLLKRNNGFEGPHVLLYSQLTHFCKSNCRWPIFVKEFERWPIFTKNSVYISWFISFLKVILWKPSISCVEPFNTIMHKQFIVIQYVQTKDNLWIQQYLKIKEQIWAISQTNWYPCTDINKSIWNNEIFINKLSYRHVKWLIKLIS